MKRYLSVFEKVCSGYYNKHENEFYRDIDDVVGCLYCNSWFEEYLSTYLIENYKKNVFVFTKKPPKLNIESDSCLEFVRNSYVKHMNRINDVISCNDNIKDIDDVVYWMLSSLHKYRYNKLKIQNIFDIVKNKSVIYGFDHEELCLSISHSGKLYFLREYPDIIKRLYDFGIKYIRLDIPVYHVLKFIRVDLSYVSPIHKKMILDLITTRIINLKRIPSEYHTIELVDHLDSIGRNIDKYKGIMYDVYKICK